MLFTGSFDEMSLIHDFIVSRNSDECNCPEEDWVIGMIYTTIHMEHDTGGHIFLDCGDWQDEKLVDCDSMDQLRVAAVNWVMSLPVGE